MWLLLVLFYKIRFIIANFKICKLRRHYLFINIFRNVVVEWVAIFGRLLQRMEQYCFDIRARQS